MCVYIYIYIHTYIHYVYTPDVYTCIHIHIQTNI